MCHIRKLKFVEEQRANRILDDPSWLANRRRDADLLSLDDTYYNNWVNRP